jgi:hypothetical protein
MPQDSLFVSLQQSGFLNVIRGAVPISNTKESTLLRAAALEASVTWLLAKELFRPLFPWSSPRDEKPNILEELFDGFLEKDPQKEAILRSIINTTKTSDGEHRKREIVASIKIAVTNLCTPFLTLSQPSRSAEFQKDLENILLGAVEVWNRAQRTQSRVVASCEFDYNNQAEWGSREELDLLVPEQDHVSAVFIKALYPMVCQLSGSENLPIHPGCAIWSDQELYAAGCREFQAQSRRISSPHSRTSNSSGARRLNVSQRPAGTTLHARNKINTNLA